MHIANLSEMIGEVSAGQAAVVASLVGALVSVATLIYSKKGHRHAKAANQAVNGNEPGTPRLFDLALQHSEELAVIKRWQEAWKDSPWRNGEEAQLWVTQNEERAREIMDELRSIKAGCPGCTGVMQQIARDLAELRGALPEVNDRG